LGFLRDDRFKQKRIDAAKKRSNAREAKARIARIGRDTCLRMNIDSSQIERQLFGKVRKVAENAVRKFGVVSESTYDACRSPGTMSWEKAVIRFGQERVMECLNHKVVSVIDDGFSDVYDLQVDGHHVFALDAGVFVHNSDNIHGAEGWGPVTACKYVKEFGGLEEVILAVQAKEKKSKKEQVLLESIPKVRLARSLKAMDVIPNVPKPRIVKPISAKEIEKYFLEWGFASLLKEIWRLA
jgi:hypothetical protein